MVSAWRVCGSAVLGLMLQASTARAQETNVQELTPDEQKAMAVIQQGMVTSTISFLSSDEMAGRDTPSKELNIAAAYVAARFRGAGLEGLGPEGSFYQTNELQQYGVPASNATVKAGSDHPFRFWEQYSVLMKPRKFAPLLSQTKRM